MTLLGRERGGAGAGDADIADFGFGDGFGRTAFSGASEMRAPFQPWWIGRPS